MTWFTRDLEEKQARSPRLHLLVQVLTIVVMLIVVGTVVPVITSDLSAENLSNQVMFYQDAYYAEHHEFATLDQMIADKVVPMTAISKEPSRWSYVVLEFWFSDQKTKQRYYCQTRGIYREYTITASGN